MPYYRVQALFMAGVAAVPASPPPLTVTAWVELVPLLLLLLLLPLSLILLLQRWAVS